MLTCYGGSPVPPPQTPSASDETQYSRQRFLLPNYNAAQCVAGHQSRKLARHLLQQNRWKLQIVKRRQRAFKITGLSWIVERSFAWLSRNRRLSKDYEYSVQTSETLIDIAATRPILNRLASA